MVLEGVCGLGEAAELMGLSKRHARRLKKAYREEGATALAHGNRGRRPANALCQETREEIMRLVECKYRSVNYCHLTDLLAEREGLNVSRSTLRRVLAGAGVTSPRRRRPPHHRCRRERWAQEGMLLQIDGSRHDWLEGRGPYLTLVAAIDDATGTVPYAVFREQEDAQGYFMLLTGIIQDKGIPLSRYSYRNGIFKRSPRDKETLE